MPVGLMLGVSILLLWWITYTRLFSDRGQLRLFQALQGVEGSLEPFLQSGTLLKQTAHWPVNHIGFLPFNQHAHKGYRIRPQSHGLIAIILTKTIELSTPLKIAVCSELRYKTPALRFVVKNAMLKEKGACYYAISKRSPLLVRSH